MLFYSPHANFQVICTKTRIHYHPVSGDEIDRKPAIWANFGKLGPQYDYDNPETGEVMQGAAIVGHYYDTDLEAVQNGWDDDTKQIVESKLMRLCNTQPDRIRLEVRETLPLAAPWATYDATPVEQVVALAQATGFVSEALAYERENLDRPLVTDGLQAALAPTTEEGSDDEPPPAAKAPQRVPDPALRTITV